MDTEKLDSILDIIPDQTQTALAPVDGALVPEVVDAAGTALVPVSVSDLDVDAKRLEDDFEFARTGTRDLIKKGREALDSAILLAQSGDAPRAYEVVGNMLTAIIQANKELVGLHKGKRDASPDIERASPVDGGGGSVNIEKAVFVGRAQDLLREIRALAAPQAPAPAVEVTEDAKTQA